MRSNLRILHLPVIVMNQASIYCRALRKLSHKSDYLLFDISQEDASLYDQCDINLGLTTKDYWERFLTVKRFIRKSLDEYDIYHFHSGRTFIPLMAFSRWSFLPNRIGRFFDFLDFRDLPYLKRKGKKIVFQFWGCDIRNRHYELRKLGSPCLKCPAEVQKQHCNDRLKKKIDYFSRKYGDARLGTGDLCVYFKDFMWVKNAIDTDTWKPLPYDQIPEPFRLKKNGNIRIYHSFSKADIRGDVKGTGFIVNAVNELKAEGLPVELMFFDYLPHDDIRFYQMQADIVVDQLLYGIHGNTGVETLSMGKPTICYFNEDVERMMPHDCPVVRANPDNIKKVLRRLVTDEDLRMEIGRKSRLYAKKYHDNSVVAKHLEKIYYSLF